MSEFCISINRYKGGWWYNACFHSNLNGFPLAGKQNNDATGINWYHWLKHNYSLMKTVMMIKPAYED